MVTSTTRGIKISVITEYQPAYSSPMQFHYVFTYRITIENLSDQTIQLMNRHWYIHDANRSMKEVEGDGVVGEHPHLKPGDGFRYTSGTVLKTPVGSMHGFYHMLADDGTEFETPIAPFTLSVPNTLH